MGEDINITQMMVGMWTGKRWAGEASIQVKEASCNNGYEAESKEFQFNFSLQKQVTQAENNVYTYKSWRNVNLSTDHIDTRAKLVATSPSCHFHVWRKKRQKKRGNVLHAPNIDFNRIPRQNTHSHIILKLQSPNYYYDSLNIKVTIKTMISNIRNETAMIFERICDAVNTSYPINIFSMGTLFTKVIKIIDQHDRLLHYPRLFSKTFEEWNSWNNGKYLINTTQPRWFLNEYVMLISPTIQ